MDIILSIILAIILFGSAYLFYAQQIGNKLSPILASVSIISISIIYLCIIWLLFFNFLESLNIVSGGITIFLIVSVIIALPKGSWTHQRKDGKADRRYKNNTYNDYTSEMSGFLFITIILPAIFLFILHSQAITPREKEINQLNSRIEQLKLELQSFNRNDEYRLKSFKEEYDRKYLEPINIEISSRERELSSIEENIKHAKTIYELDTKEYSAISDQAGVERATNRLNNDLADLNRKYQKAKDELLPYLEKKEEITRNYESELIKENELWDKNKKDLESNIENMKKDILKLENSLFL